MPSTREINIVSFLGFAATILIALIFDLSAYPSLLVAAAMSLNYWAVRGLWRHRQHRVIRIPADPNKTKQPPK